MSNARIDTHQDCRIVPGPICELAITELLSALNGATAKVATTGTSEYFAVP